MTEKRCDLCGPYTAHEAAMMVMERWQPLRTGHLCQPCRDGVKQAARNLAAEIDRRAYTEVMKQLGFSPTVNERSG